MRVLLSSLNAPLWLAEALAEQPELQIHCLAARYIDLGDFGVSAPQAPPDAKYRLHTLPVWPRRRYPYSHYTGGLARVLRTVQPDLIYHLAEPSELGSAQVVRAARRFCPGAPIIAYSFENVRRRWEGFPQWLRGRAEREVLGRLDWVAACSHSAQAVLEASGFPSARIRVVYQAVHARDFKPQPDPALHRELCGGEGFLIGYVGRLVAEKGVDVLLRALALLPGDCTLAILGAGRERAALEQLAATLGISERVRWLGRVERADMARHISSFEALVLPSRGIPQWQEQFGAVLVEGMYCETVVVGSASGAIPEIIGDTGLLFPEEEAAALAAQLQRLYGDTALRERLSRAGRRRALDTFSLEAYLARLQTLFTDALTAGTPLSEGRI